MATTTREIPAGAINARGAARLAVGLAVALAVVPSRPGEGQSRNVCSKAARAQFFACQAEVKARRFTGKAVCFNAPDAAERKECLADLKAAASEEGVGLCRDQRDARLELCDALGEGPYVPDFNPAGFDADFANLTRPNPYFPLGIGHRWQYVGGDETVTVEVLDKTKLISSRTGFERKYYARGIGLFLEVNPEDGEIVQLVGCNVDPKCAALPAP